MRLGSISSIPIVMALVASSGSARAGDDDEDLVLAAIAAMALVDAGFVAYDLAVISEGRSPWFGAAITQSVLTALPYLGSNVLLAMTQSRELRMELQELPALPLLLLPIAVTSTSLVFHGIVVAAEKAEEVPSDPSALFGGCFVVGANMPFLAAAVGAHSAGRWPTPWVAYPQVALGGLALAASAHRAASVEGFNGQLGWGLLAGWSSITMFHGAVALALGEDDEAPVARDPRPSTERSLTITSVSVAAAPVERADEPPRIMVSGVF